MIKNRAVGRYEVRGARSNVVGDNLTLLVERGLTNLQKIGAGTSGLVEVRTLKIFSRYS